MSNKNIAYSAVVLNDESRTMLLNSLSQYIPEGWETIAHHMTINMGELKIVEREKLGEGVILQAQTIGISNMAIAVGVIGFPSVNDKPHVTLAVNRKEGGKPFMSNKITNWKRIEPINLVGTVEEVQR